MTRGQEACALTLESRVVGGLPLVNAILDRLGVDRVLAKALPVGGRVSPGRAVGVLLRNVILNDRQPLYTHAEWAVRVEPALLGLGEGHAAGLNDDPVGRALDRLFAADRAALLTELVVHAIREFAIEVDQLHNDSTTLTLTGEYRAADGRAVRGDPDRPGHLRAQQGPPAGPQAVAVRLDGVGRWDGADPLPGAGRERRPDGVVRYRVTEVRKVGLVAIANSIEPLSPGNTGPRE